jgi:NAD(P)-dependent dehydrogenase (short-subunit alcohol dehydrogenase family)
MELTDKVALVTGGSGDIGGAICAALAAAGCDVALTYVGNTEGAERTAAAVTKAGLIHLTHCLAVAMAPAVSVNCVAPGLVEGTRMAQRLPDAVAAGARRQAVLGKVGSAVDIADATVMLCRADTITGQTTAACPAP